MRSMIETLSENIYDNMIQFTSIYDIKSDQSGFPLLYEGKNASHNSII